MIKIRSYTDAKDLAQAVAEFLAEHGSDAVKFNNDLIPGEGDKVVPFNDVLAQSYQQLSQLVSLTMNDQAAEIAHQLMAKAMLASWNVGVVAAASPEIRGKLKELQAGQARAARAQKPEEIALNAAIEAELNGRAVRQPKKEAGAMLAAVNARLAVADHPAVLLDVVRRRLEKLVRS